MELLHKVVIDLAKKKYIEIEVTKGSKHAIGIEFCLTENGKLFPMEDVTAVSVKAVTPGENTIFNDVEKKKNKNTVTYRISESITNVTGKTNCELQLFATDGGLINSYEFYITVYPSLYDENIYVNEDDLSGFRDYMNRAELAAKESEKTKDYIDTSYGLIKELENLLSQAKKIYVDYMDELKQKVENGEFDGPRGLPGIQGPEGPEGDEGPRGPRGEKGEKGESGITAPMNGFFTFEVDEDGGLWVLYEGETGPQFEIGEDGGLYWITPEV